MQEGKAKNVGNILSFARRQHIPNPEQLTMDELKDGLQLAHFLSKKLEIVGRDYYLAPFAV